MSYPRRRYIPKHRSAYAQRDPRPLMTHSPCPMGPYAGKHLHQVPSEWLLWVDAQPWASDWPAWQPLRDYIARHPGQVTGDVPRIPLIFVERCRKHLKGTGIFAAGSAHLHTLPGHEDKLHAFAIGALDLRRDWYQFGSVPHYDVTVGKHALALRCGALLIEDTQLVEHCQMWREFFSTKPQMDPDGDPIAHDHHTHQQNIRLRISSPTNLPNQTQNQNQRHPHHE